MQEDLLRLPQRHGVVSWAAESLSGNAHCVGSCPSTLTLGEAAERFDAITPPQGGQ